MKRKFLSKYIALIILCIMILSSCASRPAISESRVPENTSSALENSESSVQSSVISASENEDSSSSEVDSSSSHVETNENSSENTSTEEYTGDEWFLILANPWNKLPEGFQVKLTEIEYGYKFDERAAENIKQMLLDARKEGLSPMICSSYRSVKKQTELFNNQIQKYLNLGYSREDAEINAAKWVAIPGTSEHNTGLAADIVAVNYQLLDDSQENTKEQKWLMENCWKYGFILRYPKDKEEITGIHYEPWHYRYVGEKSAKEIFERKLCLEEYLEEIKEK